MWFSIWNPSTRQFDYYAAPSDGRTHAPSRPHPFGTSSVGSTPEQAAWKLPSNAKRAGSGPTPRGRIASLGGIGDDTLLLGPIIGLSAILGAYLLLRR